MFTITYYNPDLLQFHKTRQTSVFLLAWLISKLLLFLTKDVLPVHSQLVPHFPHSGKMELLGPTAHVTRSEPEGAADLYQIQPEDILGYYY